MSCVLWSSRLFSHSIKRMLKNTCLSCIVTHILLRFYMHSFFDAFFLLHLCIKICTMCQMVNFFCTKQWYTLGEFRFVKSFRHQTKCEKMLCEPSCNLHRNTFNIFNITQTLPFFYEGWTLQKLFESQFESLSNGIDHLLSFAVWTFQNVTS